MTILYFQLHFILYVLTWCTVYCIFIFDPYQPIVLMSVLGPPYAAPSLCSWSVVELSRLLVSRPVLPFVDAMTGRRSMCGPEIDAGGSDSPELISVSAASASFTLLYFLHVVLRLKPETGDSWDQNTKLVLVWAEADSLWTHRLLRTPSGLLRAGIYSFHSFSSWSRAHRKSDCDRQPRFDVVHQFTVSSKESAVTMETTDAADGGNQMWLSPCSLAAFNL